MRLTTLASSCMNRVLDTRPCLSLSHGRRMLHVSIVFRMRILLGHLGLLRHLCRRHLLLRKLNPELGHGGNKRLLLLWTQISKRQVT